MSLEEIRNEIRKLGQDIKVTADISTRDALAKRKLELQNKLHEKVITPDTMHKKMHEAGEEADKRVIQGINSD